MIRLSVVKTLSTERWAGFLLKCMVTTTILAVVDVRLRFFF